VVVNVGTMYSIYEAIVYDKPLIERIVTVSGGCVKEPANLKVRIGTPIGSLIDECGGLTSVPEKIVAGGPMMGFGVYDLESPVTKGTSGILALSSREVRGAWRSPCLACGRCIHACPMGLSPTKLFKEIDHGEYGLALSDGLLDCKECGCCAYICPSHIPLVQGMRLGKRMARKKKVNA
jgi:electron transport complex protein RnfC